MASGEADYLDYELTKELSYQGATILADESWTINQPEDYNFYVHVDKPDNSHITIQTSLYGQTATLDSAWAEYTTAESSPTVTDEWEEDGVSYQRGYYRDSYLLLSGCEIFTGRGFLLWYAYDTDNWTRGQSETLFDAVVDSLSYDPEQTTIDYKDAFSAANSSASSADEQDSSEGTPSSQIIGEGIYKVGTDIPAGEYRVTAGASGGYWAVTESLDADGEIVGNDAFNGSTYVTVYDGQYLELSNCAAELVE